MSKVVSKSSDIMRYHVLISSGTMAPLDIVAVDNVDLALNVGLSLHSMCNLPHRIVVHDYEVHDDIVTLVRGEFTTLKFNVPQK